MLPELRKLIKENQKLLYTFRKGGANLKGGTNLLEKHKTELRKYLNESFPTILKKIQLLKKYKIILDDNFVIHPEFAYFAGFYITENEIEIELINFQFEPVLEKIAPNFPHKVIFKGNSCLRVLQDLVQKLWDIVPFVAGSIVFKKCMHYGENQDIAYNIQGNTFQNDALSLMINNCSSFLPKAFENIVQVDNVLAYTLYLREKVYESDAIIYYDLDDGRIGYVKHNILSKESNIASGLVFPRYTDKQKNTLKALESLSDEKYVLQLDTIISSGILSIIDQTNLQVRSILNPEYFIIDGKWVKEPYFYDFYQENTQIFTTYNEIANFLYLNCSGPLIMKKEEQPQKGAAIYAAYSFFGWELKW